MKEDANFYANPEFGKDQTAALIESHKFNTHVIAY